MVKVARFSNGHSDEYKGKRDVKAGWMITDSAGKVLASGHSLDREKAQRTAESHDCTRKHYLFNRFSAREAQRRRTENAEYRATLKIEVVDVVDE